MPTATENSRSCFRIVPVADQASGWPFKVVHVMRYCFRCLQLNASLWNGKYSLWLSVFVGQDYLQNGNSTRWQKI